MIYPILSHTKLSYNISNCTIIKTSVVILSKTINLMTFIIIIFFKPLKHTILFNIRFIVKTGMRIYLIPK